MTFVERILDRIFIEKHLCAYCGTLMSWRARPFGRPHVLVASPCPCDVIAVPPMPRVRAPLDDSTFNNAMRSGIPWVPLSGDDLKRYNAWLQKQSCQYCGARYADRAAESMWVSEWDCGCRYRRSS